MPRGLLKLIGPGFNTAPNMAFPTEGRNLDWGFFSSSRAKLQCILVYCILGQDGRSINDQSNNEAFSTSSK